MSRDAAGGGRGESRVAASTFWLSSLLAHSLKTNSERFRLYALPDFANRIGIYLRARPSRGWAPNILSLVGSCGEFGGHSLTGCAGSVIPQCQQPRQCAGTGRDMARRSVPRGFLPTARQSFTSASPMGAGHVELQALAEVMPVMNRIGANSDYLWCGEAFGRRVGLLSPSPRLCGFMTSNSSGSCADPSWSPCAFRRSPGSGRFSFAGSGLCAIVVFALRVAQVLSGLFLRPLGTGIVRLDMTISFRIDPLVAMIGNRFSVLRCFVWG